MEYQGYTGVVEVDEEAGILYGRVVGLRDVITFQGATVAEARRAFEESVDAYLEFCAGRGEAPEKPYSGKFVMRVKPELHRKLASEAEARKTSLNALVETALVDYLGPKP
jgi:predicted HicB family RNase H-like nuclease